VLSDNVCDLLDNVASHFRDMKFAC